MITPRQNQKVGWRVSIKANVTDIKSKTLYYHIYQRNTNSNDYYLQGSGFMSVNQINGDIWLGRENISEDFGEYEIVVSVNDFLLQKNKDEYLLDSQEINHLFDNPKALEKVNVRRLKKGLLKDFLDKIL